MTLSLLLFVDILFSFSKPEASPHFTQLVNRFNLVHFTLSLATYFLVILILLISSLCRRRGAVGLVGRDRNSQAQDPRRAREHDQQVHQTRQGTSVLSPDSLRGKPGPSVNLS